MIFLKNLFSKKDKTNSITIPFKGFFIDINDYFDNKFHNNELGSGFGIRLNQTSGIFDFISPFDGKINLIFPNKNAFVLETKNNLSLYIQFGNITEKHINKLFVNENQDIKKGTKLLSLELDKIKDDKLTSDILFLVLLENNNMKIDLTQNWMTNDLIAENTQISNIVEIKT
ncbi:PTS glucose transporter subunit IIA [Mycoplasmopsis felis]|uniref:PTS glucose transporter subunit IIA n=1 Tax=Mycoplasmopsis felis TaxID=33923 RepID=UPI002AFDD92D|nr:PTS glucose transporter subunit IIA [Mycoplasmopsis felis]WQQ04731.1 PTS glucose transporter subunit IIA [Mycoplasmopsis felis]